MIGDDAMHDCLRFDSSCRVWAVLFLFVPVVALLVLLQIQCEQAYAQIASPVYDLPRDRDAFLESFPALVSARPDARFDDSMLADQFARIFHAREWPEAQPTADPSWQRSLPSPRLQVLCWLAECNKRMCWTLPEVRRRNRAAILEVVVADLGSAVDDKALCGLLDVAYRTVFYRAPITPADEEDADGVVRLFMEHVGHSEPSVHEFARERLRHMGYSWPCRYDEIKQFLIHKAPEIRDCLTARHTPGIVADPLTGKDRRGGPVREEDWLALDTAPVDVLVRLVRRRLSSGRSVDSVGQKALGRLLREALDPQREAAFRASIDLMRDGIRPQEVLWTYCRYAAEVSDGDGDEEILARVEELLRTFVDFARSQQRRDPMALAPEVVLRGILSEIEGLPGRASQMRTGNKVLDEIEAALRKTESEQ